MNMIARVFSLRFFHEHDSANTDIWSETLSCA